MFNPFVVGPFKFNIHGVSKGNSGLSSESICIRNGEGNLIYPEGRNTI